MNSKEAKKALAEGKRLTHTSFTPNEWVQGKSDSTYIFEDGCMCSPHEFWFIRNDEVYGGAYADGWTVLGQ